MTTTATSTTTATTMLSFWLLISAVIAGALCVQWSADLPDGATVYACDGQEKVSLTWSVTPDTGEHITDLTWLFVGHSDQLIALYSYSNFLPSPSYSQRVHNLANAGIALDHVTHADAGNYTVEVNVQDAGGAHVTQRHTVTLQVVSGPTAKTDATLDVVQQPTAVYDSQTGQYHVELTCSSHGRLPSSVIWTTPSHQTLQSSRKNGDAFSLLLPNPVTGGNYNCRLPLDSPAASCLLANDSALEGANVFVDDVKARITIVEAGMTAAQQENNNMKTEISKLKTENTNLNSENSHLNTEISALKTELGVVNAEINNLTAEISSLKTGNTASSQNSLLTNEMSTLKSEMRDLKTAFSNLATQNSVLIMENIHLQTNVSALKTDTNDLKTAVSSLLAQNVAFSHRIQGLEDLRSKQVLFHARLAVNEHLPLAAHIKPTVVSVNQGHAYSPATGEFIVPLSGFYFFTATAAGSNFSANADFIANIAVMVDSAPVSFVDSKSVSYFEQGTCSYATHLNVGQKVWLINYGDGYFRRDLTTFSGFLVSPD